MDVGMDVDPDPDPELSALLRARRPEPSTAFVAATERRLFRPRRRWLAPRARLGTAFAGGLAVLVLVLSLAGVGPLAGGDRAVQADEGCHTAHVVRTERVPSIVTGADGQPKVVYSTREVPRLERRCR